MKAPVFMLKNQVLWLCYALSLSTAELAFTVTRASNLLDACHWNLPFLLVCLSTMNASAGK